MTDLSSPPSQRPSGPRSERRKGLFDGALNFEQQRKRAKDLLKALQAKDPVACARGQSMHPALDPAAAVLADAQLVIARECGFASWPRLKHYCQTLALSRTRTAEGRVPCPDTAATTHLRCGSDIRQALEIAGFIGSFLEFSDPFCHGPVTDGPVEALKGVRVAYLSGAYGLDLKDAEARTRQAYAGLEAALTSSGGPLVLWFEHDAYDQLILAYVLARCNRLTLKRPLELICVDSVPGVDRFVGLGQLAPEVLLWLWDHRRQPVSAVQKSLGSRVWQAFATGDVSSLWALAAAGTPEIPAMAGALRRHLQELPATGSGLGLTQSLTLSLLQNGPMSGGGLFRALMNGAEPLPWLGDMMYWRELADLLRCDPAPIAVESLLLPWPERQVSLTPVGQACLRGERDLLTGTVPSRWFGALGIGPGYCGPRWSQEREQPEKAGKGSSKAGL